MLCRKFLASIVHSCSGAALADLLLNCSDRVKRIPERPMPEPRNALRELEQSLAIPIGSVSDTHIVAQIRARLALNQEAVPFAAKLVRLQAT
jgi:hypothetical protein